MKPARVSMGIATKVTLLLCAIVIASSCAVGLTMYWRFSQTLVNQELRELSGLARNKSARFISQIDVLRADALLVSRTPVVQEFIAGRYAASGDKIHPQSRWRLRNPVISLFTELLRAKPHYSQVRLIGIDGDGREVFRVERVTSSGEIRIVPDTELQQKGQEPFFAATLRLAKNEVYLSELNLNREHGSVSQPATPVMRAAAPVYDPDGRPVAILIINRLMQPLIDSLRARVDEDHSLLLANDQGEYLAHSDAGRTFAFEFDRTFRIQQDYPELSEAFTSEQQQFASVVGDSHDRRRTAIGVYKALFDPQDRTRFIAFALFAPYDEVVGESTRVGHQSLWISSALLLVSVAVGYVLSRSVTSPLRQITSAAEAFGRGEADVDLPTRAGDETGILARALKDMMNRVETAKAELQRRAVQLDEARLTAIEAEQATRDQAVRTQAILDNATDAIITIDVEGRVESFNLAAERTFGHRAADVIGKNVNMLMPSPYHEEHDQYIRNYLSTGISKIIGIGREVEGLRADGSTFPLDLSISEVKLGNRRIFTGIVRDISERKRGEEELRRSEARKAAILETAIDAIITIDHEGRIVEMNSAAEQTFGYRREDALGQLMGDLIVPPRMREEHRRGMERYLATGEANILNRRLELTALRADGGEFSVEVAITRIAWDGPPLFTGFLRDITARKLAEQQLREANDELAARARQIERFNVDLRRSNEELAQFAYVASHDLQEPLRKVNSFCQMLEDEYSDRLDDSARQYIRYAVDGATRMKTLVQDLLTYSRVETQGKPLRPTDVDHACREAIDDLAAAIEESGAEVSCDPLPMIRADRAQLVRLFQNLIGNAIKYRGAEPPRVHVSAEEADGHTVIRVRDNGIGIDPQYHERIFVIFQRLHGRSEYSGTGIGLAVSKRIVERFGGRIWVESQEGAGSTFCMAFPKSANVLAVSPVGDSEHGYHVHEVGTAID